ncbi:MAG: AbrB/MazE/SpoVT family DNA-binding domain-containing protein [Candidatus Andersenbacteria bacterium]|nr:AbrB/MazE/SpoVT family DNA-binding domain-containing protein [Candidatus Andersenbacteria bacterium]
MKSYRRVKYVKSFSKGQITIPKEFREELGLGDEFWLKLFEEEGKIVAEPAEPSPPPADYTETLRTISGDWFDARDYRAMRKEVSRRFDRE